ncbi:MAG: PilZ domain-containing protein [Thermoanaerobaculia bacterium]|nr:PilZ domain-containing protein [Thermoanaerobaculia bacterium]
MASDIQTAPLEGDEPSRQRGATRAPVRKPVRLQFDDAIDVVEAWCRDLSIGGMFVHSEEGRPVGSLVRFELLLGEEMSIRGLGEVVWMRAQDQGPERVAGIGLKFRFLEQRDRQLIFKLVSQHIKERLAARHPGLGDDPASEEPEAPPPIHAPASTVELISKPVGAESEEDDAFEVLPSIDHLDTDDPNDAGEGIEASSADGEGQRSLLFDAEERASGFGRAVPAEAVADSDSVLTTPETTGAWLQQGLDSETDDSFETSAGFGADEGPPAEESVSELYGDDTHFEHRPKPRRDIPILTVAALLVTALAVSVYLWGDKLFERGAGEEVSPSPLAEAALGSDPVAEEAGEAAERDQIGASRDVESSLPPADAELPDDPANAESGGDSGSRTEKRGPTSESRPSTSSTPPSSSSAGVAGPSASGPFRAVLDISARVAGPAVEVVITTDGRVDADRFSHSRLPEGAPRELIRLRGLNDRFTTERIPVGIGAVRQVRTGWHRKSGGNELHVVIDLADPAAEVTGLRVEGQRIIASVKG